MRVRVAAIAVAAGAVLLAGCGSDSRPKPVPTVAAGRFAGSNGAGIGAAVDFVGFDPTKLAIERALTRAGGPVQTVGIVSLVNRTKSLTEIPRLWAVVPGGALVRLAPALRAEFGGRVRDLPDPGPYIPVEGALTVYVLFPGTVDDIRRVQMTVAGGKPVELRPEPRPSS